MEQRRFLLFFVASMAIVVIWTRFLSPLLMPLPPQPPAQKKEVAEQQESIDDQNSDPVAAEDKLESASKSENADGDIPEENEDKPVASQPAESADKSDDEPAVDPQKNIPTKESAPPLVKDWDPDKIKHRNIKLGSLDPETGYFMEVELTSLGAGVLSLELNDPRYRKLDKTDEPLALVEANNDLPPTFGTVFYGEEQDLKTVDDADGLSEWSIAQDAEGNERIVLDPNHAGINQEVTFRAVFSELGIEVFKTYRLVPSDKTGDELETARLTNPTGYELMLEIDIHNLSDENQTVLYDLQGPVGVPLENRENTRKFRQVAVGFLREDGTVSDEILRAKEVADTVEEGEPEVWFAPMQYIGIDIQYFASLVIPGESEVFPSAMPMLVSRENDANHSDLSVVLQSKEFELLPQGEVLTDGSPGDSLVHHVKLFAGPKREVLLDDFGAGSILDYGRLGVFASFMLKILNFLHFLGIPYGIAIIILTVMVRGCLYPLSRKQAIGAKKMKELQPKLKEIKKKYAKNKEKQAQAQMELFRKHNYNPLAGCFPLLLQFPIFISLYTAISSSVDLRLAPFLWINNLAAPDALFRLPFELPFLGQNFNLLPILTIGLFIAQQQLFMPPPETEEQAMQYKMMKFMMIFMGFMFYRVPAGLCLYFITSSLWGMSERKLLDVGKTNTTNSSPSPQPGKA
ncbi:MAG: membrane protein insertase YidC [Planctomycetaceae bacterium]|nr:membrane protein insertase YidC [Planctomycetaceae bacterium]